MYVSVYMIFAIYISLVFSRNFKVFFRRNLINDIVIRTLREFDELSFKIISVGLFLVHSMLSTLHFNRSSI